MKTKYTAAAFAGLAVLASAAFISPVSAEALSFKAALTGTDEVPATTSKGTGVAEFTYDTATKMLAYKITYAGLSGAATAAHIHGPAEAGKNSGVAVPFANPASPIEGSAALTDAQAGELAAGKMYVNVHTAENKGGEIRGQIVKK